MDKLTDALQYVAEELEAAYEKLGQLASLQLDDGDLEWAGRSLTLRAKMAEALNEWCGYEAF